jgi:hypothetical protein
MYMSLIERKQRLAGQRYEAFIAWSLRQDGWEVQETGRDGVNDHGIDLIASKDGKTRYVQCKGWKWWKTIHENVVSQLLGSVAAIEGIENLGNVEMYIYSPARLDDYAKAEAHKLNIWYVRVGYPGRRRRVVD